MSIPISIPPHPRRRFRGRRRERGRVAKTLLRTYIRTGGGRKRTADLPSPFTAYPFSMRTKGTDTNEKRVCDAAAAAMVEHFCVLVGGLGLVEEDTVWKLSELRGRLQKGAPPSSTLFRSSATEEADWKPQFRLAARTHARLMGPHLLGSGLPHSCLPAPISYPHFFLFLAAGKAPKFPSGASASVGPFSLPPSLFLIPVAPGARREREKKKRRKKKHCERGGRLMPISPLLLLGAMLPFRTRKGKKEMGRGDTFSNTGPNLTTT